MSTKSVQISSLGLKNISLNRFTEEDDFIMIFGNQEIRMNRIFAEFISPVVSRLHETDPTIQSINFEELYSNKTDDFNKFSSDILSSDIISLFREISSGFSIDINHTQAIKLRFLSIILGNEELLKKINEIFPQDFSNENLESNIDLIQCYYYYSRFSPNFDFTDLVDYLSRNFYLIDEDQFLKLPRTIQYSIISNQNLQIKSEDSLLDLVSQIIDDDDYSIEKVDDSSEKIESISFLEHIEFTGLSETKLREFLCSFDFNRTTNSLWRKFYECFFIHFDEKTERIHKLHSTKQTFEYDAEKGNRFEGIIHHLTEKFGGNVDDKGIVKLSSSSVFVDNFPRNAVELTNNHLSFSTTTKIDKSNGWLKFDFLGRKVHPTNYSIRSCNVAKGNSHLKDWVIEGSNSDKNWKILDSRENENCLNDRLAENTFKIQEDLKDEEYYRYLRIRQTGLNFRQTSQLMLNSLEFFGTIIY